MRLVACQKKVRCSLKTYAGNTSDHTQTVVTWEKSVYTCAHQTTYLPAHLHTYIHMYTNTHIHRYTCTHTNRHPCMYAFMHADSCNAHTYIHTYIVKQAGRQVHIWCRVAASQAPPPPWYAPPPPIPPPSHAPRLSFQQTVIRHPRNCPPKLGLAPWPTHGTTRQGTTGAGWGRITHNTGNHRAPAPSPSPPLRHTDDNDGDDVVHNDVDVLFPVWLLVVHFLLCCSGLRQRMFIALFS